MIRAGMTIAEAILQLTKGFRKMMGRDPDGLEKIKIQQEAARRIEEVNKVVDMEGNVIDTSKGIMGGKQIQDSPEFGARIRETYDKAQGPGKGQKMVDALKSEGAQKTKSIMEDNLGMKLYGDETFEEILEIQRTGKHPRGEPKAEGGRIGLFAGSVPKILKLLKDPKKVKQAIDNIFPTGDVKYDATMAAESLVELNPKIFGNKLYDDLDSMTRLDIYDAMISPMMSAQAKALRMKKTTRPEKTLQSMKEGKGIDMSDPEIAKEFEQFMRQTDPKGVKKLEQTLELDNFDPKGRKKNAKGGRAGFKIGSIDKARRAFLKTMGAAGAGITALKTGLLGLSKEAAPAVEAVKETVTQAPSYFFDLAAKIKTLGRMSDGPAERIKQYSMKGKDGKSELLLTEDIGTGEMQIKKIGKEGDDMVTDVQTMEYTPGSSLADETTKGIPADQYDEYTEFQSRIYKDEFNDLDIVDGINVEDIIKEVKDQAPPIKKAGGGIARMLGE